MKTASMVLGIVGGALAIITAIILILLGTTVFNNLTTDLDFGSGNEEIIATSMFGWMSTIYTVIGIVSGIGGIAGLVGGLIVKNNNTAGGVLMIVGTVLGCLNIVLLVGAIFAFIRDKQPAPVYAPYPPYPPQGPYMNQPPYPPYPPQPPVYPNQYPQQPPKNPADNGQ